MPTSRLSRAEQQERNRDRLLDAAEASFIEDGFHAVSLNQIAGRAGHTTGVVYSNFASKEDLFLAVYARRAERRIAEFEKFLAGATDAGSGLDAFGESFLNQRGAANDGWLAVFYEFWAHAIRRPTLRDQFANIHLRMQEPFVRAAEEQARAQGFELLDEARRLMIAGFAMQMGLRLQHLMLPDLVDDDFRLRMHRLFLERMVREPNSTEEPNQ